MSQIGNSSQQELLKRAEELFNRCDRQDVVTCTRFLTPAEQYELTLLSEKCHWSNFYLYGGQPDCERKIAFFLPFYMSWEDFDPEKFISAIKSVTKFANPSHRDYLGSLVGIGIERDCIGDIWVTGECAYFFCISSVEACLLQQFNRVGRAGAKTEKVLLQQVPLEEKSRKAVSFTVKSVRFDAIASGMFGIARSSVSQMIEAGNAVLNYRVCLKKDAVVSVGDSISIRGYGKGIVTDFGGQSKKGRIFVNTEIYK